MLGQARTAAQAGHRWALASLPAVPGFACQPAALGLAGTSGAWGLLGGVLCPSGAFPLDLFPAVGMQRCCEGGDPMEGGGWRGEARASLCPRIGWGARLSWGHTIISLGGKRPQIHLQLACPDSRAPAVPPGPQATPNRPAGGSTTGTVTDTSHHDKPGLTAETAGGLWTSWARLWLVSP